MSDKEDLQDPLKPLDKIHEPDVRQASFVGTLEERHEALEAIVLNDAVPIGVRQLFETAKNLSLYSWFVYRFHQVAELVSFAAMEMALRERFYIENPIKPDSKQRDPTLFKLLQHAKKSGWMTNEGFPSLHERARFLAEDKKMMQKMKAHDFKKEPSMLVDDPTEEEVELALLEIDMVEAVTSNAHKVRNNLAHGSSTLHPNSISTLSLTAEIINQIYPE